MKDFTIKQFEITGRSHISCTRPLIGDRFLQARRILPLLLSMAMLAACSTTPQGRKQLTAPAPISNVYSDVDMRIQLATVANATCLGTECSRNLEFDQQVQRLGYRLSGAAFETDPDLNKRISHFEFVVAEKEKPGTASNASGTVVIFRGVQKLGLDDEALAFLIAREMGHIICQHHNENSSAKILVSVLASVLFPAIGLFTGSAALANVTSATVSTTAASTATSFLGSQVVVASIKPTQSNEADTVAIGLLSGLGWDEHEVSSSLEACTKIDSDDTWAKDFRISVGHLKALDEGSGAASVNLNAKPSGFLVAHDTTQKSSVRSTLIDTPVDDLKEELNGESDQTPSELINASDAVDEPVPDAGRIIVNTARNDLSLDDTVAVTETSVSLDKGNAALDASSIATNEALQGPKAKSSLTDSEDGLRTGPKEESKLINAPDNPVAPTSVISGSQKVKIIAGKDANLKKPKEVTAGTKSAKKTHPPGSASNQVAKVKAQNGPTKKTSSGRTLNSKDGKGIAQPSKLKPPKTSVGGKHENLQKTPGAKGSKQTQGGKEPKQSGTKPDRATSSTKAVKKVKREPRHKT